MVVGNILDFFELVRYHAINTCKCYFFELLCDFLTIKNPCSIFVCIELSYALEVSSHNCVSITRIVDEYMSMCLFSPYLILHTEGCLHLLNENLGVFVAISTCAHYHYIELIINYGWNMFFVPIQLMVK